METYAALCSRMSFPRAPGASFRKAKDRLLTLFEVTTYGSALLLLPCAFVGLFGCNLSYILIPVMLGAVTGTVVLTGIAIREGWYFDHLTADEVAPERVEPTFAAARSARTGADPSRPQAADCQVIPLDEEERKAA